MDQLLRRKIIDYLQTKKRPYLWFFLVYELIIFYAALPNDLSILVCSTKADK